MTPKEKEDLKKEVIKAAVKDGGTKEIIIREGKALEPTPKIKLTDVKLVGTIEAPGEYYAKRPKQFKEERANIMYSKNPERLYITLKTIENKERPKYEVTGKLILSEELLLFGIAYKASQTPKQYTVQDLAKLLRFNKRLFTTAGEAKIMIEGLTKFKIKVSQEAQLIKDKGGNITDSFAQTVKHDCPMEFNVSMPLYKGKKEQKFKIEINFEVKSANDITMWLESTELSTIIETQAEAFINEELEKMKTIVQIQDLN